MPLPPVPQTVGTFPIAEVSNGHTFFVQKLHDIVGVPPVCVHTTFQFGDTAEFTWGKRSRLREKQMWRVDDDGYYRRQGAGMHPAEATYEGYLLLSGTLFEPSQLQVADSPSQPSHAAGPPHTPLPSCL